MMLAANAFVLWVLGRLFFPWYMCTVFAMMQSWGLELESTQSFYHIYLLFNSQ